MMTTFALTPAEKVEFDRLHELASEIARTASVAGRHLSRAESGLDDPCIAQMWRQSADEHEAKFGRLVDHAREVLARDDRSSQALASWLDLFGATSLVAR